MNVQTTKRPLPTVQPLRQNFDFETQSLPLLFVLHGYTGQAPIIRQYSGFDQISNRENFIVVYVQGTTDAFGNTGWNVNVVPTFNYVDDVGLFKALIKYFKANYNIDSSKIFSTGMSLGGFMSYRLACELDEINSIKVDAKEIAKESI